MATRKCVFHALACALIDHSWPSSLTASHRLVVLVLGIAISETVADQNGLQVDIPFLMAHDLRCEDRNVMSSIRFTRDMEVLMGVFGELFEE